MTKYITKSNNDLFIAGVEISISDNSILDKFTGKYSRTVKLGGCSVDISEYHFRLWHDCKAIEEII